ncbi:MAG TPA: dihydropteroate synthase [Acidimicrobiia bacterium]|nr:dihydropteroate synthase [Acidimicrobiia bacterium]
MFEWERVCGARAAVMGIVNVTPDSFSDGGLFLDPDAAVAHGIALAGQGADVLDVGGESTRPGAAPVPADEELRRVLPVVERLAAETSVPISVDTTKAAVARAALDAGATVVNDVSAGRLDPDILGVAAEAGAGYVVMHMQGEPRTMQADPHYDDVVAQVGDFLADRVDAARAAGVAEDAIAADPGIGFGKTVEHNLRLLAGLPALVERVRVPVMVGTSRKTFVGKLLARAGAASGDLPVDQREEGTLATVVWAVERGASIVRVHDVLPAVRAVRLLDALRGAEAGAA